MGQSLARKRRAFQGMHQANHNGHSDSVSLVSKLQPFKSIFHFIFDSIGLMGHFFLQCICTKVTPDLLLEYYWQWPHSSHVEHTNN